MKSYAFTLDSGLPEFVSAEEPLARFLTSSGHFNSQQVKPAAFMPNPANMQTSVFRNDDAERLRECASKAMPDRRVHGVAIVSTKIVRETSLDVQAQEPPARHANIVGWASDPVLAKSENKMYAIALAQNATRHIFHSSNANEHG